MENTKEKSLIMKFQQPAHCGSSNGSFMAHSNQLYLAYFLVVLHTYHSNIQWIDSIILLVLHIYHSNFQWLSSIIHILAMITSQ